MLSDEDLVANIRQGDLAATDELYSRYKIRLFRYIRGYVHSAQDAEEIFHDAFLAALRDRRSVYKPGSFAPWVFRVARNAALNHRRSSARYQKTVAATEHESLRQHDTEAEIQEQAREEGARRNAVNAAVQNLAANLQEVFRLRSSGLSYEDMADVLNVPLGTVKSRVHQMVTNIRKDVGSWIAR